MGMEEDPEPGSNAAVAASIFIAVAVYAVCLFSRALSLGFCRHCPVMRLQKQARLKLTHCNFRDSSCSAARRHGYIYEQVDEVLSRCGEVFRRGKYAIYGPRVNL